MLAQLPSKLFQDSGLRKLESIQILIHDVQLPTHNIQPAVFQIHWQFLMQSDITNWLMELQLEFVSFGQVMGILSLFLEYYELTLLLVEGNTGVLEMDFTTLTDKAADMGVPIREIIEVDFV